MSCHEHAEALLDWARGAVVPPVGSEVASHLERCEACAERFRRQRHLTGELRRLADATAAAAPDDGMEARLAAEFERRHQSPSAVLPSVDRGARTARGFGWRPWMAAAAAVVVLAAGAGVAWRMSRGGAPEPGGAVVRLAPVAGVATALPEARAAAGALTASAPRVAAGVISKPAHTSRRAAARAAAREMPAEFVAWPGAVTLPPFESGQLIRTELPASVVPLLGFPNRLAAARATVVADVIVGQDGLPRAVRLVNRVR
jgi:hypothetical protein